MMIEDWKCPYALNAFFMLLVMTPDFSICLDQAETPCAKISGHEMEISGCLCNGYTILRCKAIYDFRIDTQGIFIRNLLANQISPNFVIDCFYYKGYQPQLINVFLDNLLIANLASLWKAFIGIKECIPYGIYINKMKKLSVKDFERLSNNSVIMKHLTCLNIRDSFSETFSNGKTLDLSQYSRLSTLVIKELEGVKLFMGDPQTYQGINLNFTFNVKNTDFLNNKYNFLSNSAKENIQWTVPSFYPRILQEKTLAEGERESYAYCDLDIRNGPEYMHKEMLFNTRLLGPLFLGRSFQRIEYGTLVNENTLKSYFLQKIRMDSRTYEQDFMNGNGNFFSQQ